MVVNNGKIEDTASIHALLLIYFSHTVMLYSMRYDKLPIKYAFENYRLVQRNNVLHMTLTNPIHFLQNVSLILF